VERFVSEFFKRENIEYYSFLDVEECELLYPRKLPDFTVSVCFFLIPYMCRDSGERNVSLYAVPRDYHLFVRELSDRFERAREAAGLSFEYRIFADNSPFCERTCAEKCGIGKRGRNGLIINPVYGSYVFIGSICFSTHISITQKSENFKGDLCGNCEKCKTFCPMTRNGLAECLSAVTQKKKVTDEELLLIASHPVKWGCDICQKVCPYNKDARETQIEFFKKERIPYVTPEILLSMSEDSFSQRAYSWRGRDVIKRNINT